MLKQFGFKQEKIADLLSEYTHQLFRLKSYASIGVFFVNTRWLAVGLDTVFLKHNSIKYD